jgi:hypothetical protein
MTSGIPSNGKPNKGWFNKGHKHSKEILEKNRLWHMNRIMPLEHRLKISDALKNNPKNLKHIEDLAKKNMGSKHWNWKGGISEESHFLRNSDEYKMWRNQVYAMDNWTCQECGVKLKKLVAHHIKSFKEYTDLRFVVSNGITLCRSCHKMKHADIGKETRFK